MSQPQSATSPAAPFTLSPADLAFFRRFGFLAFPGLVADRIDGICAAFEQIFAERGGGHDGKPHDGIARSCIVPFIDQSAVLSSLLDDPRVHAIGTALLGDDFNYMGSDGNFYVGDTGWHSDGWHREQQHLKIAFYLEELDGDSGALRVIPGSHVVGDRYAEGVGEGIGELAKLGVHGSQIPAQVLKVKPGDVLVFNHNTKHASFNGGKRRRMFTINLCQRHPEHRLPEFREYVASGARFLVDQPFGPHMMASATPARMRHLEQVLANSDLLRVRVKELKELGATPARG